MTALTDRLMWAFCWLAFQLVGVLPIRSRLWAWLLPYAGFYGYHEDGLPWRWSERGL